MDPTASDVAGVVLGVGRAVSIRPGCAACFLGVFTSGSSSAAGMLAGDRRLPAGQDDLQHVASRVRWPLHRIWRGPVSVVTACSSSLVALHMAVGSLRSGVRSGARFAASPSTPPVFVNSAGIDGLAPDGRCSPPGGLVRSAGRGSGMLWCCSGFRMRGGWVIRCWRW